MGLGGLTLWICCSRSVSHRFRIVGDKRRIGERATPPGKSHGRDQSTGAKIVDVFMRHNCNVAGPATALARRRKNTYRSALFSRWLTTSATAEHTMTVVPTGAGQCSFWPNSGRCADVGPSAFAVTRRTLQGFVDVAPDTLRFDPREDGDEIHRLTAGLKRLVIALIVTAYRAARALGQKQVYMADLRNAYKSLAYTVYREDVEALTRLAVQGRAPGRKDLVCPFPNEARKPHVVVAQKAVEHFTQRIDHQHLLSSLTAQEREGAAILNPPSSQPKSSGTVLKMKRSKPTVESLLAAEEAFRRESGIKE